MTAPTFAFIGFGEFACALATALRDAGGAPVLAYARRRPDAVAAAALDRRLAAAGVEVRASVADAARDADIVVAAVPAAAAAAVAGECAAAITEGAVYVDPAPQRPAEKALAAERLGDVGALYVDAAVLGTVAIDGARVPILAAGPGAQRFADAAFPLGLDVTAIEGPPGRATTVKLLRSVYMKGRDALVLEMLIAARRHGVEQLVLDSIRAPGEQIAFEALAARVMSSLALYAERRADELAASADVLDDAGVEPIVTRAGAQRLRWMGDLGLRDHFHGERPGGIAEVLAAIDALEAPRP